jgi:hypothetical protein
MMTPCCSGNRSISRNIAADRPFFAENYDGKVMGEKNPRRNDKYTV